MTADSWTSRLYQSIRNYRVWPHFIRCTPPISCKPVDTDDEVEFWSDLRYLQDLVDAILDDTRLARIEISDDIYTDYVARPLLEACCVPVESAKFWEEFDWPVDYAAHLLSLWRMDRELDAWMQCRDIDEEAA